MYTAHVKDLTQSFASLPAAKRFCINQLLIGELEWVVEPDGFHGCVDSLGPTMALIEVDPVRLRQWAEKEADRLVDLARTRGRPLDNSDKCLNALIVDLGSARSTPRVEVDAVREVLRERLPKPLTP